jgi:hypothetical protein
MRRKLLLAALFCALPAQAVTITNLTTNTVLFQDNFESGGFSSSPGLWSIAGPDVTVTNAASPGAAQGSFYASLFRNSDELDQGNLQASFTNQTSAGDLIQLRMMVWLPDDGQDARGQFFLDDGDFNSARAWARPDGAGHVDAVGPGLAVTDTGLVYTPGVWQEWDLYYAIGSSTFDVAVNGVKATGFTSASSGGVGFADLFNGSKQAGTLFLDGIPPAVQGNAPEPATWWLAVPCLLALFRWRRKLA